TENAQVVEGSNGLLLQVDGQIVPNYDATLRTIEEGEVVTGHVVRIDKDEVLVDIGYKSEGVIPAGELSIRKSVDPNEEVHLGEEVDAIVLTKEDQEGRLMSTSDAGKNPRTPRSMISPPLTTSITVPSTGSPDSAAASIRRHAFSKRACFLDMIRRPS